MAEKGSEAIPAVQQMKRSTLPGVPELCILYGQRRTLCMSAPYRLFVLLIISFTRTP